MQDHLIKDMVRKLKPVLKDADLAEAILKRYWRRKIALVWEVADVYRAANERGRALTSKEAIHVLEALLSQYNPQLGIRWEDLWAHLDNDELGRKMTKAEIRRFVAKDIIAIAK